MVLALELPKAEPSARVSGQPQQFLQTNPGDISMLKGNVVACPVNVKHSLSSISSLLAQADESHVQNRR